MIRRFRVLDWFVVCGLIAVAFATGRISALLAVIALFLYLILRYVSGAFEPKTMNEVPEDSDTFIVYEDSDHDIVHHQEIELDRDIDFRTVKGRFRFYSRFDLCVGKADYEYKCDGDKIFFRLLNQLNEGESTDFKHEWDVRDGVVLVSDLLARDAAKKFKIRDVDKEIADLKKAVEWHELQPASFGGFKYFLVRKCLPRDDARRYLRQEVERLKVGNGKVIPALAEYGLEPDLDPKSVGGWKQIQGREVLDTEPFWAAVDSGVYGISQMECGSYGLKLVADLQKLLGDGTDTR